MAQSVLACAIIIAAIASIIPICMCAIQTERAASLIHFSRQHNTAPHKVGTKFSCRQPRRRWPIGPTFGALSLIDITATFGLAVERKASASRSARHCAHLGPVIPHSAPCVMPTRCHTTPMRASLHQYLNEHNFDVNNAKSSSTLRPVRYARH